MWLLSRIVTCDHADASALVTCDHADASALVTCDHRGRIRPCDMWRYLYLSPSLLFLQLEIESLISIQYNTIHIEFIENVYKCYEGRERENIQYIKIKQFLFLYPPLTTADASAIVTCDHKLFYSLLLSFSYKNNTTIQYISNLLKRVWQWKRYFQYSNLIHLLFYTILYYFILSYLSYYIYSNIYYSIYSNLL